MNPLEKEFVPYPEAFELKQLEFDEPCFGRFDGRGKNKGKIWYEMPNTGQDSIPVGDVLAPTNSQAFRWFREKYDMFSHLDKNAFSKYYYDIHNRGEIFFDEEYFNTPEEAELTCLRKLIEIVKNK